MSETKIAAPGDQISPTFCILPWIHLNTWPNGNVYPCCLTDYREELGNMKDNTLEELWNVPRMKEIRRDMLLGKKHDNCRKCYQQEKNGLDSTRTSSNLHYKHHIPNIIEQTKPDGTNERFELLYWDFRFSNLCNFKCRMCGAYLSSKWFEDEVKIFGGSNLPKAIINVNDYSKKDIQYYLNKFIEDVEEIYFAGGEPLIMDEHYYIMEKLIEIGHTDVRIRYNTNLGYLKFKKWDNLKIWEPFRKVNNDNVAIFASIDGINEVAEYKRKGTKWPVVEGNIKKCIDEKLNFHVSCTTSVFNVLHIPTFVDRMIELGLDVFHIQLNNILTTPHYYNINILPKSYKDKVKYLYNKHLENFEGREREELSIKYDSIFKFMDEKPEEDVDKLHAQFKSMTDKIDKGRDENFLEVYPYYTEWYNNIGKKQSI